MMAICICCICCICICCICCIVAVCCARSACPQHVGQAKSSGQNTTAPHLVLPHQAGGLPNAAVSGRVLRALLLGRRRSEATLRRGDALAGELRPLGGLGQAPALEVEAHLHQQPRSEQQRGGRVGAAGGDKTAAYRVLGGRDGAVQDEPAPQLHAGHGCAATILCTQLVSEQPPRRQPCAEGRRCKTVPWQFPRRLRELASGGRRWRSVGAGVGGRGGRGAAGKRESRPASDRARQQQGPCSRGGSATP